MNVWCPQCAKWTPRPEGTANECLSCGTLTKVAVVRSEALEQRASQSAFREAAFSIAESVRASALKHAGAIDGVLRQLVKSGRDLSGMSYDRYPDGREVVRCGDVRAVLIVYRRSGTELGVTYQLYPDGRPEGWPELTLEVPQ